MKFSIIVPIYNAEKYLKKCIESILKQTYRDFQLVLVNDGSTDKSLSICNIYAESNEQIKVISQKNLGSILARRTGINEADGEYITFVDADDWLDRSTLELVDYNLNNHKADVVVFNMYRVSDKFSILKKVGDKTYFNKYSVVEGESIREDIASAYFHGHPFPPNLCGKVYRKDILSNNGIYLNKIKFLGEDLFYNLEIFLKIKKVTLINKPLYYYRTGGNTSKFMPYLFNDLIEGYKIQKKVIEEYYIDTKEKRYNGSTAMLLNTFKTCLFNLFLSSYNNDELRKYIEIFLTYEELVEAVNNEIKRDYFDIKYLNSILNKDVEYLFLLGLKSHNKYKINLYIKKYYINNLYSFK